MPDITQRLWQRPTSPAKLGNHEDRIRALERNRPAPAPSPPNLATFWRNGESGDDDLLIAAGDTVSIPFLHWALPTDDSISQGDGTFIEFQVDCLSIEWLTTTWWEDGSYLRSGVLGTDTRIVDADLYNGQSVMGYDISPALGGGSRGGTMFDRPNMHLAGDTISGYCDNGDSIDHNVTSATLAILFWPVSGLNGDLPAWPQ